MQERVIFELKANPDILIIHSHLAHGCLKPTGMPVAFVINFGAERIQFHLVVKIQK
jgi:hypothetical protein